MTKWYWIRHGDRYVIREDIGEVCEGEGEYVCEIDIRYLTKPDWKKARNVATEIMDAHNKAKEDGG